MATPSLPTIRVFTRSTYGQTRIYVDACANQSANVQAQMLARLTGTLTLTESHVSALRALGFTVEQVPDPRMTLPSLPVASLVTMPVRFNP